MKEKEAILAALRDALEFWSARAKTEHQRGIIYGLQIAIQEATVVTNSTMAQNGKR